MCEKCAHFETQNFPSENDFRSFQKKLDKACLEKQLETIPINHYNKNFESVYNCTNCKENWILSYPENAWRGFFLTKKQATAYYLASEKQSKQQQKASSFVIILLLTIILAIIYESIMQ